MKKIRLVTSIAVLVAASALLLTGCPKDPVDPAESDPVTPETPVTPDDPDEPDTPVTPDEPDTPAETDLISSGEITKVFFAPGWGEITEGVSATNTDGKLVFVMPAATTDEWQAQVFLKTTAAVEADKCYDVSYKITPSVGLNRYTIKFDADAQMVYKNDLTADAEGKEVHHYIKPTVAVENIVFVYDFGGNAAQTVEISELKFTEMTQEAYDEATYVPPVTGTKNEVLFAQDSSEVTDAMKDELEGWWNGDTYYLYETDTETFEGLSVKKCSSGANGGCFGIYLTEPVTFKAGAKLQVTAYSDANFSIKPVAPDVASEVILTPNEWTTYAVSLGEADGELTKFGIIVPLADQIIYIKDVRIIDNE